MKKTWASAFGFIILMVTTFVWAAPVPDTGVTKCYDNTDEIPCPSPDQAFYGQDANYAINPMSYTKLDGSGNVLPDSATSWVTVRDNVTGLIWEMKTNMDGVKNYNDPHDSDNTYIWYDSNPATNGGNSGTSGYCTNGSCYYSTEDFINVLNSAHFGGYSDWRLPTINELHSIVKYDTSYPAINTTYFPNTQVYLGVPYFSACVYWSSTTSAYNTADAWGVSFGISTTDEIPNPA
ncbi:MAG: DUF1566 domain-containing protein [Deltaproteobacteria bacterium]|nr:DUF1566 domain-containing protein [Deltaproteobacteria bacterium]